MRPFLRLAIAILIALATSTLLAQRGGGLTPEQTARRWDIEKQLQSIAVVERKVMMPMRDGVRLATDIYRPKDTSKKVPIIWVRTPYNFNYWDVRNGLPSDMTAALTAVQHGYAYVVQNERGHFFSEGNYDILGAPTSDGDDALTWMAKQAWSNGKVGTTGCSSTAEYQMAIASLGNPAYAAMNVQGFGAGVGRVAPYFEQGNWYRGGAVQMLFITWIYGEQNQVRPTFPAGTSQQDLIAASRLFDLAPQMPRVDWSKALWQLPEQDILKSVDGPRGIFADAMPVPTGGRMIQRAPNDPAWYKGGLYHDDMPLNVPGLYFMSWYDVSIGPNLALFNHVRKTAKGDVANAAVGGHRAGHALRLHARDREHDGRRAQRGRCAPRLCRADLRVLRSLPEGRRQPAPRPPAEGAVLHDGHQQVAVVRHVAARRCAERHLLPVGRRPREHDERRRHARHGGAGG